MTFRDVANRARFQIFCGMVEQIAGNQELKCHGEVFAVPGLDGQKSDETSTSWITSSPSSLPDQCYSHR